MPALEPIVYRGNKEIADAVGLNSQKVGIYVSEHGLPAFKPAQSGTWVAFKSDLVAWLESQRDAERGE